jgi:hypothetical protein
MDRDWTFRLFDMEGLNMSQSWFGGDTRFAHWAVSPADHPDTYKGATREDRLAAKAINRERSIAAKAHAGKAHIGKDTWYFEYRVDNQDQKAAQKISADALAKELEAELGFPFSVNEGCFL